MIEYPLVQNLDKIKNNINLNIEEKVESVKTILLEEINYRQNKKDIDLSDGRFDVACAVFGPKRNKMTHALAKLEATSKLEDFIKTFESFDPEFKTSVSTNLLLTYLENHKYYLGNDFFEVLYDVFGEKADFVVEAMYNRIQKNITNLMGQYYPNTTAEENKIQFSKFFQEKFKDTYFEIMVIQFTNDYVKNGATWKA